MPRDSRECFICVLPCFQTIWNTVYTPRSTVNWASKPQLLFLLICQVETAPKVTDKKFIRTPRASTVGGELNSTPRQETLSPLFASASYAIFLLFGHLPTRCYFRLLFCLAYLSLETILFLRVSLSLFFFKQTRPLSSLYFETT